ncbi:hypothetical protein CC86DRAFT_377881 [Ophiobolus disseminans]|uniref:Uncharacterized protein n=1 Tax=Ophiobolus disseminans TaxID=1469910 RepID=A0A6A7ACB1_9PLEO|nr:hypothetical protein CC86DRAFT_377881 [Ophiobolus disseminans]
MYIETSVPASSRTSRFGVTIECALPQSKIPSASISSTVLSHRHRISTVGFVIRHKLEGRDSCELSYGSVCNELLEGQQRGLRIYLSANEQQADVMLVMLVFLKGCDPVSGENTLVNLVPQLACMMSSFRNPVCADTAVTYVLTNGARPGKAPVAFARFNVADWCNEVLVKSSGSRVERELVKSESEVEVKVSLTSTTTRKSPARLPRSTTSLQSPHKNTFDHDIDDNNNSFQIPPVTWHTNPRRRPCERPTDNEA